MLLTRAFRDAARSGVPVLATAASRVRGRMRWHKPWRPMVAASTGEPRVALSYVGRAKLLEALPWRTDAAYLAVTVRPNGLDGVTVGIGELQGRIWTSLSYYASHWDSRTMHRAANAVGEELERLIDDRSRVVERTPVSMEVRDVSQSAQEYRGIAAS